MDPRPYVSKAEAKKLKARGKVEGRDFVIPKTCSGPKGHMCLWCFRIVRRYDQRCRP